MPDIIISLNDASWTRLITAFGKRQGLGRDGTLAEIKTFLNGHLREIVRQEERAVEEAKIVIPRFDPT